jgi:hypothetical protein
MSGSGWQEDFNVHMKDVQRLGCAPFITEFSLGSSNTVRERE